MATYSIPGQNLNFAIPDEGQVFRTNIGGGDSIFVRSGGKIYSFSPQSIGSRLNPNLTSGAAFAQVGTDYLASQGVDVNSIPTLGYNAADFRTAFGDVLTGDLSNIGLLKSSANPQYTGETITQGVSPTNPNAPTFSSSVRGDITPSGIPSQGAPGAITPPANAGDIRNPNPQPGTPQATAQNQQSEAAAQAATHNGADVPLRGTTTVPNAYTGNPTTVPTTYQVKPGDTINGIAAHLGVPASAITGYRSGNPNLIYPGETLHVGPSTPTQAATSPTTPSTTTPGQTGTPAPTTTANGKTPQQNVMDMWTSIATSLGLPDIKSKYEQTLKDQQALQEKMDGEIQDVNNNPWLSTGVRANTIKQIQAKYDTKLNTYSNFAKLYDSLYQEGIQQAQFLAGHIETDTQNAIELAQKKLDAAAAIAKDNQIVSINGSEWLVNKSTGEKIANLGPTTKSSSSTTDSNTKELDKFQADVVSAQTALRNGATWGQVFNQLYARYANGSEANKQALRDQLDAQLGKEFWSQPGAYQTFLGTKGSPANVPSAPYVGY